MDEVVDELLISPLFWSLGVQFFNLLEPYVLIWLELLLLISCIDHASFKVLWHLLIVWHLMRGNLFVHSTLVGLNLFDGLLQFLFYIYVIIKFNIDLWKVFFSLVIGPLIIQCLQLMILQLLNVLYVLIADLRFSPLYTICKPLLQLIFNRATVFHIGRIVILTLLLI